MLKNLFDYAIKLFRSNRSLRFVDKNAIVEPSASIGDYSYINSGSYIEHCEIGKYCSIGPGVRIGPINHEYTRVTTHPFLYEKVYGFNVDEDFRFKIKRVNISNDVWIGANSIICQGCSIGNGAVIAAGSVLTKNVPDYEIWGGVPAKFIKKRFDDVTISKLQSIQWWDWDVDKINENIHKFSDPLRLLDENA